MDNSHFSFFESLLEDDKYETLKTNFIIDYLKNGDDKTPIDIEKGIIHLDQGERIDFSVNFSLIVFGESYRLKNHILNKMYELLEAGLDADRYLQSELVYLQSILSRLNKMDFNGIQFDFYLNPIIDFIKLRLGYEDMSNEIFPTFNWYSSSEKAIKNLSNLYTSLLSEKKIDGSKQDFINGFLGKQVKKGIKWMVLSRKNKLTSKPSLFYFIDILMHKGLIDLIKQKDYNDAIIYVFRDSEGNEFQRASLSTSKSNNTLKEDSTIKKIVDSINPKI